MRSVPLKEPDLLVREDSYSQNTGTREGSSVVKQTTGLTLALAMSLCIFFLTAGNGPGSVITPTFRSFSGQHLASIAEGLPDGSGARSSIVSLDATMPLRECSVVKATNSSIDPTMVPNASRGSSSARDDCFGHYMREMEAYCCGYPGEEEYYYWYRSDSRWRFWEEGYFDGDYICGGACQNEESCWHEPPDIPEPETAVDQ